MSIFDNPYSQRILTAEITYYDVVDAVEKVFYAASESFATGAGDTPEHTQYIGCIQDDVFFERSMYAGENIGGAAIPDRGALTLINTIDPDGVTLLDDWSDPSLVAVDGRSIKIYLHEQSGLFSERIKVFDGKVAEISIDENVISLIFMSYALTLQKSIIRSKFAGTGGDEGASNFTDKPKPLVFGKCYSVPCLMLDNATLRGHVHDGAGDASVSAFLEVRDMAYPLVLSTDYTVDDANGIIDLVASPAGDVVVDVEGSELSGTYSAKAGSICSYIAGVYAASDVDTATITAVNSSAPQMLGLYVDSDTTMFDVIDEISRGIGNPSLSHGFNRAGEFTMQMFALPSGTAAMEFDDIDIIDETINRAQIGKVAYKVTLRGCKNWSTTDKGSMASALDDTTKELYAAEYQITASAEDVGIKTIYPEALELKMDTLISDATQLSDRAAALLDFWGTPRFAYSMTLNLRPLTLELGDVILVTHPRFSLSSGKLLRVVTLREYYLEGRVELVGVA